MTAPVHIQKGFHVSCKQKKDREDVNAAKNNIAARRAPNARFVREVVFANCDDEVIGITFVGGPIP